MTSNIQYREIDYCEFSNSNVKINYILQDIDIQNDKTHVIYQIYNNNTRQALEVHANVDCPALRDKRELPFLATIPILFVIIPAFAVLAAALLLHSILLFIIALTSLPLIYIISFIVMKYGTHSRIKKETEAVFINEVIQNKQTITQLFPDKPQQLPYNPQPPSAPPYNEALNSQNPSQQSHLFESDSEEQEGLLETTPSPEFIPNQDDDSEEEVPLANG